MQLNITLDILYEIKKAELSLEDYVLLEMLAHEEEAFINVFLSISNKNKLILQKLFREGYIEVTQLGEELYSLTDKANEFLKKLNELT